MMKIFLILGIIFIILTPTESLIKELNDETFDLEIGKYKISFVVFHAPWCGQCRKLMKILPEIEKRIEYKKITIFKVDCETNGKNTCKKKKIGGYPILKSFKNGKEYGQFDGRREVENIINFIEQEISPISHKLDNFLDIEKKIKKENSVSVIATFQEKSKLEEIFLELAEKLRKKLTFSYSYINDSGNSWIKLFRNPNLWNKFEDNFIQFEGTEYETKDIENFIWENYHGLVGIRTFKNKNEFKYPLVTVYYDIDFQKNSKLTHYWRNRVLKIATKYKDKFQFSISSINEFYDELMDIGVKNLKVEKPVAVAILETKEKFILNDNFSVETFDLFLHNVVHGMMNPYLKSQHPPKDVDSYVITAVGSTFYRLVINNQNDTMVKLYAEWCEYCKKIAPIYKKLAEMMKNENITFFEIDATLNDVPVSYSPTGYPTIYWSTKEYRMNPILYKEKRTVENFIKFIAKHASNELKDYDRDGKPKNIKIEL